MSSILFHITSGPNDASKAMLGFLLARTAADEGHNVEVFLSGDGVQLVRDIIINNLVGLGTGNLKEHMMLLKNKGVTLYVSSMSCENRGIKDSDLIGKKIKKGDTIMIVEAMKTMNHVPSTADGVVKEICVEDGQAVEFGQTIIILD